MAKLYKFIPDYKAIEVISSLSEVCDWGQAYTHIDKYRETLKTKGEGMKVVILDTGQPVHVDLNDNIKGSQDFTGNNDAIDRQGHSSHVHGIIGAIDNGVGVIGIAPRCDLYSGKVLDNNGLCPGDYSWIMKGLEWAIEINADIVNMSLGAAINPPNQLRQLIKTATDKGMILIAAAGNEGQKQVDFPGRFEEVIAVAAMTENGQVANYSNVGQGLDFIAPGSDVYSTYLNDGYAKLSGTSMSSPFIAGISALILAYHRTAINHTTPITNYKELQQHIDRYEKGSLIDLGDGNTIGILDFATGLNEDGTVMVSSAAQDLQSNPEGVLQPVHASSVSTGCAVLAFKWILNCFNKKVK